MNEIYQFPPQQLPFSKKTKAWRKKHCDWASSRTFFNCSPVRSSTIHKCINYDLLNGKIHMQDMMLIINPENIKANYIPDQIQHYPIMNSKLDVLRGEESKRVFDFKVVVTNPNAVASIEETKKNELFSRMQQLIQDTALTEEEFNQELERLDEYYNYQWQDIREIRANALLNHYMKEYNIPLMFNEGFMDALAVAEEAYMCDIVSGEPTIVKLNPKKLRVYRSGYSNKIEDADVVVYEDYWSPGKIIDTYYDSLTEEDRKYIENLPNEPESSDDSDRLREFIPVASVIGDDSLVNPTTLFEKYEDTNNVMPYDTNGNIRVLKVFWKSKRKVKQIKRYNPETGEEEYELYPENYITNKDRGEEEKILWINQAWEGTKIGEKIYVNMRPRLVQYNRLSNPSKCHFGIIGSIYNLNESTPFSLVDKMKPYNYLYDAVHDRLNKLLANSWGKLIPLDLAKVPAGWNMDKWLYYARKANIMVVDSFKEGNVGAATGKIAGALNNNSSVIDAELGNSIQMNIQLLEFIKNEMSEVAGISRQREGQISNRETVGGVERATVQSSHITEWLFFNHDDVKKRVLECFLETAKIALKGNSKKFQYILPDYTMQVIDIEGDEFAECDYGLVVDNSSDLQSLKQKMDMLAQAALQNQTLNFSTIMKLYNSGSLAEKQRIVEKNEQDLQRRQQEAQQQQMQLEQQRIQEEAKAKEAEMQLQDMLNARDNETKIQVALIGHDVEPEDNSEELKEKKRQFDEKLKLEKDKLKVQKEKNNKDAELKLKQINKPINKQK